MFIPLGASLASPGDWKSQATDSDRSRRSVFARSICERRIAGSGWVGKMTKLEIDGGQLERATLSVPLMP